MKKQPNNEDVKQKEDLADPVLSEKMKEIEMWKNKYIRALADYQNMEKRVQEEQNQVRMFACLSVIEKLLPVVDLLEKAQTHLKDQGLELALKELAVFFRNVGIEKIHVLGKPFDPYSMDCIEIIEGGQENTVVSVLSDGYRMHTKVIRPAKVKVGKKLENRKSENS